MEAETRLLHATPRLPSRPHVDTTPLRIGAGLQGVLLRHKEQVVCPLLWDGRAAPLARVATRGCWTVRRATPAPSVPGCERRAGLIPACSTTGGWDAVPQAAGLALVHGCPSETVAEVRTVFAPFQLILWSRCLVPQRRRVWASVSTASESSGLAFPVGPA